MTMVKQRRSFFVDDILHMVMPMDKPTNCFNDNNDRKRKRSITPDDEDTKKFRLYNNEEEDDDESKHSQIVDVLGDGGTGEESSISDNSNSVGNNSGKSREIYTLGFERSLYSNFVRAYYSN